MNCITRVAITLKEQKLPTKLLSNVKAKSKTCKMLCKKLRVKEAISRCMNKCNKERRLKLDRLRGDNGRGELQSFRRREPIITETKQLLIKRINDLRISINKTKILRPTAKSMGMDIKDILKFKREELRELLRKLHKGKH